MPKHISEEAVYHATLETLIKHGYTGATTKRIAAAAGMNEVTLFRKFGSKRDLVRQAIRRSSLKLDEGALAYTGDVLADLGRIAHAYSAASQLHSRLMPLIMSEMSRHKELRDVISGPHAVIARIAALMQRYQQAGLLDDSEEPFAAVASFLGPLIVVAMLRHAAPSVAPVIDIDGHVRRFVAGRQAG